MTDIVIIGSGGHAKVLIEIIELSDAYKIIGIITKDLIAEFEGYPVLGDDTVIESVFKQGCQHIALGIGGFKNNNLREELFNIYSGMGFKFPQLIHPNTFVSSKAKLGAGVVVFAGCTILVGVSLSDNVVVCTGSSIDHETQIGAHVLVSAGVTIGACISIGAKTLVALGAKIISGINVGCNVLIGAGAVVVSDIEDNKVVFGIPAKDRS